jgi:uncharacterized protein
MKIVWDETKRTSNVIKHGLDFAELDFDFFETATFAPAKSGRLKAIGRFKDGTIAVVFAVLGTEGLSIVSMRPASKLERNGYAQQKASGFTTHH